jgi:hypothetical protein
MKFESVAREGLVTKGVEAEDAPALFDHLLGVFANQTVELGGSFSFRSLGEVVAGSFDANNSSCSQFSLFPKGNDPKVRTNQTAYPSLGTLRSNLLRGL